MAHVYVRLLLSVALFSSWGNTIPVDVADPKTWFTDPPEMVKPENLTGVQTSTDSVAVLSSVTIPAPSMAAVTSLATSTQPSILSVIPSSATKISLPSTESTSASSMLTSNVPPEFNSSSITKNPLTSLESVVTESAAISSTNVASTTANSKKEIPTTPSLNTTALLVSPELTTSVSMSSNSTPPIKVSVPAASSNSPRKSLNKPSNNFSEEPEIVIRNRERPNRKRPTNKPFRGRSPVNREQNVPKDTCDLCTKACKKNMPICSKPEGMEDIDTEKLRGFPSTCHMVCFNNCRKIRYEKVMDGRCGRLKNRVRPVGSKSKLNRVELSKTKYQVETDEEPLFLFSPLQ